MTTFTSGLLVVVFLIASACGPSRDANHEHGHDEKDEHGEAKEHDDHDDGGGENVEPNVVRIDPGMLRDLRITTAKSESRPAGETVTVLGQVELNQAAYAEVASPIPAQVRSVLVDAGAQVAQGQVLAALASADIGRARAELSGARTRASLASQTLERKRALLAEKLVPAREVQEAEAAAAEAQAGLATAEAAVRGIGAGGGGGGSLELRAPIAGTIITREVALGQLAGPEQTLFRIGDLTRLWVTAHVFERDAVRVRSGITARVALTAFPGRSFEGSVTLIGKEVDPVSRTIPVRLELPNPDGALRPGMSASIAIPLTDDAGTVVAVPLASVQRVGEGWSVFVPKGQGVFEARPIGRGRELGGEIEVLHGLAAGVEVVVDGAFLLKAEADKARGEGGGHHDH